MVQSIQDEVVAFSLRTVKDNPESGYLDQGSVSPGSGIWVTRIWGAKTQIRGEM